MPGGSAIRLALDSSARPAGPPRAPARPRALERRAGPAAARARPSRRSCRSTPSSRRISVSACRPVSSTVRSASRSRSWSGLSSRRTAPACTVMTLTECATTSCSSRAIRLRSSSTARCACSSLRCARSSARRAALRMPRRGGRGPRRQPGERKAEPISSVSGTFGTRAMKTSEPAAQHGRERRSPRDARPAANPPPSRRAAGRRTSNPCRTRLRRRGRSARPRRRRRRAGRRTAPPPQEQRAGGCTSAIAASAPAMLVDVDARSSRLA